MNRPQTLLAQAKSNGHVLQRWDRNAGNGWGKKVSDSQRAKLYTAEGVIRSARFDVTFKTPQDLVAFVRKVETDPYVVQAYGQSHRRVMFNGRMRSTANGGEHQMSFPANSRWAWCRSVVLHEIAHGFATPQGDPGHAWLFCNIFADLVEKFMGSNAATELRDSFDRHNVKHEVPKAKRAATPAQLDRMAAARAARGMTSIDPHVFLIKGFTGSGWLVIQGIEAATVKRGGHIWDLQTTRSVSRGVTRTSEKGVADMLARLKTFGARYGNEVVAVPAKDLGSRIDYDWQPAA